MDAPEVSVVIPAYNEETRIGPTLDAVLAYLSAHHPKSEVIVVDDGSRDGTVRVVQARAVVHPNLRLLTQPKNAGKGAAVRRGMLDARGKWVLFSDADLATPIEELATLMAVAERGAQVVIGSRALPASDIRVRQPRPRELMGRTFNRIVQTVILSGIRDTQCGFKLFTHEAAQRIFAAQTVDRFAFDVEILLLAKKFGYRVEEIPVAWSHVEASRVSPTKDAARMFVDVLRLRFKHRGAQR